MNDIYDGEKMWVVCGSRPLTLAEWYRYESEYRCNLHNYWGEGSEAPLFSSSRPSMSRWFEYGSPSRFFRGIN